MDIPYERSSSETLRRIIEESVLREGTEYGEREYSLDEKVTHVLKQLKRGDATVTYDETDESCSIRRTR